MKDAVSYVALFHKLFFNHHNILTFNAPHCESLFSLSNTSVYNGEQIDVIINRSSHKASITLQEE